MDMNSCVAVATKITDADRDDLLSRVDGLIASGMAPQEAQSMAATDMLDEIEREKAGVEKLVREQHPDLYGEKPKPPPKSEVFGNFGEDEPLFSRRSNDPSRHTMRGGRIKLSIDDMVHAALSMSDWKDWFNRHEETIAEQFGDDADLFKQLLAATSQAATVPSNVSLALKAYRQLYSGEDFKGYLPAVVGNLERIRIDELVRGPKISQYDRANGGDPTGVAVDRHIAELMFNTLRPNKTQISAAHRRINQVAELLGWEPRQVQSVLWAYNQVRRGVNFDGVQSYDTLLKKRAAEIAALRELADNARAEVGGVRGPANAGRQGRRGGSVQSRARSRYDEGGRGYGVEAAGVDDGIYFSKKATLDAMAGLPTGVTTQWDAAKKHFYVVKAGDPTIIAVGKKVVDAIANYKKAGGVTVEPKQYATMQSPGAQDELDQYIHAAMQEEANKAAHIAAASAVTPGGMTGAEATKFLKDNGVKYYWNTTDKMWAASYPHSNILRAKKLTDFAANVLNNVTWNGEPGAKPVAKPATPVAAPAGTPSSIKKLFAQWETKPFSPAPYGDESALLGYTKKPVAPDTKEFEDWFGQSKVVDSFGRPLLMYHGTAQSFYVFKPKQAGAIFASGAVSFAKSFVSHSVGWMQGHGLEDQINSKIMPMWVKTDNPFDYDNPLHVDAVVSKARDVIVFPHSTGGSYSTLLLHPGALHQRLTDGHWQTIEGAKIQEIIRGLGFDGFWMKEGSSKNIAVYSPDQVKLATLNVGSFGQRPVEDYEAELFGMTADEANAAQAEGDMRFSTRMGRFELPEFTLGSKMVEGLQDRYNRWKQTVEAIRKQGGVVSEDNEFYRAEERYWGKVGAQIEDFKEEVEDWTKEVTKDKLDLGSVALYAYAQHAPSRNAYIASIRPTMPDGGSGMTNADAQAIIDEARNSGLEPLLQKHADKLREWIQGTRDHMLAEGLITPDEYATWTVGMPDYVPLRGMPDGDGLIDGAKRKLGIGQGFNIRGKESKTMQGRRSEAKQIIENILADRSKAYIRAGKNEVLRHFLKFVLDNPSPNLWRVNAVENKPATTIDANGNRVIEERQSIISDDRTVTVKDDGKEIHIEVVDPDLRAQLQNLNAQNIHWFFGSLLYLNRVLSRLYTSLSPVFTVTNLARDLSTATFGAIDEFGFLGAPKLWAQLPASLLESFKAEFGARSPDYELYRATGGKTGFFDFKTIDDLSRELTHMADTAQLSAFDPRKALPKTLSLIEKINGGIENATRLASFKAARRDGKTVAEAAHISKNLTVNFNRKGAWTPMLSSWFLFFNPAVQGTARMLEALRNPKVLAALGAGMTGMFLLAMRNAAMGDDDDGVAWWDKIPDEVKERNLIIVRPPGGSEGEAVPGSKTGRYIKVPMPYGYNFFAVMANQAADVWRNGQDAKRGVGKADALKKSLGAFFGSWIPVPEAAGMLNNGPKTQAVLAAVPDAFNPIAQNILNINPFGRALHRESNNTEGLPNASKSFGNQVGGIFEKTASLLNRASGGTSIEPGFIDLSAGQIENLVRGYAGGPATFSLDILNAMYARQSLQRPELDVTKLPFAKQVYGKIDAETDRMLAYSRMDEAQKVVNRMRAGRAAGDDPALDELEKSAGGLMGLGATLQTTRARLSSLRKSELAILNDDTMTDKAKMMELQLLNRDKREALQAFNEAYNDALLEQRLQEEERKRRR